MKKLIIYNNDFEKVSNIDRNKLTYLLTYYAPDVERVKAYYIYSNSRKSLKYIDIYEIGHKALKYRIIPEKKEIIKYNRKRIVKKYAFD